MLQKLIKPLLLICLMTPQVLLAHQESESLSILLMNMNAEQIGTEEVQMKSNQENLMAIMEANKVINEIGGNDEKLIDNYCNISLVSHFSIGFSIASGKASDVIQITKDMISARNYQNQLNERFNGNFLYQFKNTFPEHSCFIGDEGQSTDSVTFVSKETYIDSPGFLQASYHILKALEEIDKNEQEINVDGLNFINVNARGRKILETNRECHRSVIKGKTYVDVEINLGQVRANIDQEQFIDCLTK